MPDLEPISNLCLRLLAAASIVVWVWIGRNLLTGREILPLVPRERAQGNPAALLWGFVAAFFLPYFLAGAVPQNPSLARVQMECGRMLLQLALLGGVLAVTGRLWKPACNAPSVFMWRSATVAGCLGCLASAVPVMVIQLAVNELGLRDQEGKHVFFKILEAEPGAATAAWIGLAVIILAPLVEELMYRLILQDWAETRYSPREAIVLVAALFAAVHFAPGRPDYLPLFPLALILGYVRYRLHSYLAVVVLHGLFNAVNLVLALLSTAS